MTDSQDGIDTRIAEAARDLYNRPPETPAAEMWAEIESHLDSRAVSLIRLDQRRRRATWWMAIAAALVIGLALGRLSLELPSGDVSGTEIARAPSTELPTNRSTLPYEVATRYHLDRVESLLLMVRTDAAGSAPLVTPSARSLLARTRLLLETPGAADPEIRALLEDLELMLMQVVVSGSSGDPQEAGIVGRSLVEGDLLLRLRSATSRELSVRGS